MTHAIVILQSVDRARLFRDDYNGLFLEDHSRCLCVLQDGRLCLRQVGDRPQPLPLPICPSHMRQFEAWADRRARHEAHLAAERRREEIRAEQQAIKDRERVYFGMRDDAPNLVKIGYSTNVEQRLQNLRCRPLLIMRGDRYTEKVMHQRFAHLIAESPTGDGCREWFRHEDELATFIAESTAAQHRRSA